MTYKYSVGTGWPDGANIKRRRRIRRSRPSWRDILYENSQNCFYCGLYLELHESTADHRIPKSLGGPTNRDNLVLACLGCNGDKGSMLEDEWREWVIFEKELYELYVKTKSQDESTKESEATGNG